MIFQYLVPVAIPVVLAVFIAPLVIPSSALPSPAVLSSGHAFPNTSSPPLRNIASTDLAAVELDALMATSGTSSTEDLIAEAEIDAQVDAELNGKLNTDEEETRQEVAMIEAAEAKDASSIAIQGGKWDEELHKVVKPSCHEIVTKPYRGKTRTGFASFPRSGNSYLRSLLERATGYQTSSLCEPSHLFADARAHRRFRRLR